MAENQGLCESLRIRGMSHFPWGGWEGLGGGEDQYKLIEKKEQLKEEQGPSFYPRQPSQCPKPSQKGQYTCCFLSVRFYQKSVFPAPGIG